MDFGRIELTPDQERLQREIETFFDDRWEHDDRIIAVDHERTPAPLRLEMADRGWVHPKAPPSLGGAGLDAVEARILDEAMAQRSIPTANMELLLGTMERHGSAFVRENILPDIVSGRKTICLGYSEPACGSDLAAAQTKAVRAGDAWVINGQKMFTTWGHESDYVFLLARTGTVEEKHRGLTVFLVPMDSPGVEHGPVWILGDARTNVTYYADVEVADDLRIGDVGAGWRVLSEPLAIEHGHGSDGTVMPVNGSMGTMFSRTLTKLIDHVVDFARGRTDDSGTAMIDDPRVRAVIVEALIDLEVGWNSPGEHGKPVTAEILAKHTQAFMELLGPESVVREGRDGEPGPGVVAWSRLYAPGAAIYGGTTAIYWNNIARAMGLPRPY